MVTVNVHEAKTHLSRLLAQVEAGEEVIIARNGKPVAQLVRCRKRGKRKPGSMEGLFTVPDSFFEPLSEEELAASYGKSAAGYERLCSIQSRHWAGALNEVRRPGSRQLERLGRTRTFR